MRLVLRCGCDEAARLRPQRRGRPLGLDQSARLVRLRTNAERHPLTIVERRSIQRSRVPGPRFREVRDETDERDRRCQPRTAPNAPNSWTSTKPPSARVNRVPGDRRLPREFMCFAGFSPQWSDAGGRDDLRLRFQDADRLAPTGRFLAPAADLTPLAVVLRL